MRRPVKESYCGREINPTDLTSLENNKFLPKTDVFGGPPCLDIEKCIENVSKVPNHRTPQFLIMNGCVASKNWPFDASDRVFAPYKQWRNCSCNLVDTYYNKARLLAPLGFKPCSCNGVLRGIDSMSKSKTFRLGRDSKSGLFITVKEAERRPTTTTVERVPKAGYGDTGSSKSKGKK